MQTITSTSSAADIQSAALKTVQKLIEHANSQLQCNIAYPTVTFRASGKRAGTAFLTDHRINLHRTLLQHNPQAYLDDVIPHEVAHLVVYHLYGNIKRIKPHGIEWQTVMENVFQVPAKTTHKLDISVLAINQWRYQCGCQEHLLSSRRHGAVQRSKTQYVCRLCNQVLTFQGE